MQMLDQRAMVAHWKAKGLDFSRLFTKPEAPAGVAIYHCEAQDHKIHNILDRRLIAEAQAALDRGAPVRIVTTIKNTDRTAGAMLSGEIAKRYGHAGLPDDTIHVKLTGTAGQSFGAWLARGVTLELEGEGNDYVGKGLSGGRIIVRPPADSGHHARGVDHRRQHRAVRRDRGRMLFPRHRRRALRGAQFRRHRGGRGRRRPLLRIHDRRRRGGARAAPAATSRPACRAASPTCSTRTARSRPAATWRWSSSSRCRTRRRSTRANMATPPISRPMAGSTCWPT